MSTFQIQSVAEPFLSQPDLAFDAVNLLARADVMGFLPDSTNTSVLDMKLIRQVFKELEGQGLRIEQVISSSPLTTDQLRVFLRKALEVSETSAMPLGEWPKIGEILGEKQLAQLLSISESSAHRYKSELRPTPQVVAERLHELALIIADLAGAYNNFGVRRWFNRPRVQLDGKSPQVLLGQNWDPNGSEIKRVRNLAGALLGSPVS